MIHKIRWDLRLLSVKTDLQIKEASMTLLTPSSQDGLANGHLNPAFVVEYASRPTSFSKETCAHVDTCPACKQKIEMLMKAFYDR